MNKRFGFLLTLLFTTTFLFGISSATNHETLLATDIQDHWAQNEIQILLNAGVVMGELNGEFQPDRAITRAEFVTMLVRAFRLEGEQELPFSDVLNHWARADLSRAYFHGILQGVNETEFAPDAVLTREQLVTFVMRAAKFEEDTPRSSFNDMNEVSTWAVEAVSTANHLGLIQGSAFGLFLPKDLATRAEALTVLYKTIEHSPYTTYSSKTLDSEGVYGPSEGQGFVGGDVTITCGGITLQNTVIEGDLIISESVGEGSVTLNGIVVKGATYINGGGTNSIYFYNAILGVLYLQKEGSPVRVVVGGATEIKQLLVYYSATLVGKDSNGHEIYGIIVSRENAEKIGEDQKFRPIKLILEDVKVPFLLIEVEDVEIDANQNTQIETFIANASVVVSGNSTIQNATINAGGVFFNLKPIGMQVAPGIPAPTYPSVIPNYEENLIPSSLTDLQSFGEAPQVGVSFNAGQFSPLEASVTYQWWICTAEAGIYQEIENATSASYTPVAQDAGHFLQVSIRGYGDFQGYLISTPSMEVLPEDSSQSDNIVLLEAKFFLEEELGRIFLIKDLDLNLLYKVEQLIKETFEASQIYVTLNPTQTQSNFSPDGTVLDLETTDLGVVELLLNQGMGSELVVSLPVEQDYLLMGVAPRYPVDKTVNYTNILYGSDISIAVGEEGTIFISFDGVHWDKHKLPTDSTLNDAFWSGKEIIVVGDRGVIFTSRDGIKWSQFGNPNGSDLYAVTLNHNILMAAGSGGTVLLNKLDDKGFARKWYDLSSREKMLAVDLTCFKDQFVLLESWCGIHTTTSAARWTKVYETNNIGRIYALSQMIANDDKLIVIGQNGQIFYTENTIDWVEVASGTTKDLSGICWGDGRFVIVGADENAGVVLTSTDGLAWRIIQDNLVGDLFTGITWNGKKYIAVGKNLLKSSTDAVNWTDQTNPSLPQAPLSVPNMTTVTKGGQNYIMAGHTYEAGLDKPTGFVKVSTNLTQWTGVGYQPDSERFLHQNYDLIQGNNLILLVGKEGSIFSSADGKTWALEDYGSIDLFAGCWSGTQFLVVGDQGSVRTSPNGKDWTQRNSGVTEPLRDVTWNGSYYLAVGDNGVIVTSADGIFWSSKSSGVDTHLEAAAWNGEIWVVVGGKYPLEGALIYSLDASNWTKFSTKTLWLNTITWNGKQFLATAVSSEVYIYRAMAYTGSVIKQ